MTHQGGRGPREGTMTSKRQQRVDGPRQAVWFEVYDRTTGTSFGVCRTRYQARKLAREVGGSVRSVRPRTVVV